MPSRFLQALRPFIAITPNIGKPTREVSFNEKSFLTFGALVIYFVMASIPIIGPKFKGQADPFAFMRTITASTYGSLAEIGIGAIVTAGLIMQVLVGLKIVKVDLEDPQERALYNGAQKFISIVLTIIISIAFLISGIYGSSLDLGSQLAILTQLFCAGVFIIYLDEMIQRGWGFGSGIFLFIAGGVCLQIFQGLFAAQAVPEGTPEVISYRGIVFAFITWLTQRGPIEAIQVLFLRYDPAGNVNFPSLSILSVFATIIVSFIIIFLESLHINIPITDIQPKEIQLKYPIGFLYTPIIPLILASAVLANICFIAQIVWNTTGGANTISPFSNFLGTFRIDDTGISSQYIPESGLVYFLTPPRSLIGDFGVIDFADPITSIARALIYAAILIVLSVIFSVISLETTGKNACGITKQHLESEIHKLGLEEHEKMIEASLEMNIRKITIIGGVVIGSLAALADFFGVLGTGIGILLLISIIRQYFGLIRIEEDSDPRFVSFYLVGE